MTSLIGVMIILMLSQSKLESYINLLQRHRKNPVILQEDAVISKNWKLCLKKDWQKKMYSVQHQIKRSMKLLSAVCRERRRRKIFVKRFGPHSRYLIEYIHKENGTGSEIRYFVKHFEEPD